MEEITFTKRQLKVFIKDIITSSQKMCYLPFYDETLPESDKNHCRMFIERDALESISKQRIDVLFNKSNNNTKKTIQKYQFNDVIFEIGKKESGEYIIIKLLTV